MNLTIRWYPEMAERLRAYQHDHPGLHTRTAAVLHLLDEALFRAGYPRRAQGHCARCSASLDALRGRRVG